MRGEHEKGNGGPAPQMNVFTTTTNRPFRRASRKKQEVEGHGLNNSRCQQPMLSPLSQPMGPPRPSHASLVLPKACPSLQSLRQCVCVCVLCGDRGALLPEPVPGPAVRDAVPGVPHVQPGRPTGGLRLALPGLAGLLHLRGGGAQLVQAVGGHLPGTTLLLLQPWGPRVILFP